MRKLHKMMKVPSYSFTVLFLSLYVIQITTQSISSNEKIEEKTNNNKDIDPPHDGLPIINPCNIAYLPDAKQIYQFNDTEEKFRIEAQFEEDNRPCNLSITKPDAKDLIILNLAMEKNRFYNNSNIRLVVKKLGKFKVLKIYFHKGKGRKTFRGIYKISNLTFFGFPKQPADNDIVKQPVDDLTCPNQELKGRVNLTEDFQFCCEYHRFQNEKIGSSVNCCKNCLDIKDYLNVTINYNKKYLDFVQKDVKQDDQPNPLSVSCTILEGPLYTFKMKFKASASKAKPKCFVDYNESSMGLGVGLGLLFIVCLAAIFFWRKKNKEAKQANKRVFELEKPPDLPEWANFLHYPRGYLELEDELGQGGFGIVIKAKAQNLGTTGNDVTGSNTVAVKTYRGGGPNMDELVNEGELMAKLDYHYNVINLLGVTLDKPEQGHRILLILDFCSRGSLDAILRKKLDEIKENPELVETEDFNMKLLVAWTYQIAMGMKFLANQKIIHGDLAARNILVDKDNTAKIGDFGKAHRVNYDNIGAEVEGNQPMWWMAPEALNGAKVTMESDKWSYGVTVWEIFTLGEEPYSERDAFAGLLTELLDGYRMPLPERCPTEIYNKVILTSWDANPEKRPDWAELIDILHKMVDGKYLQRYDIIQARRRNNYTQMRNAIKDNPKPDYLFA